MSRLNGMFPCIERSEWNENCVVFWLSEREKIDVTLDAEGLTIHGSGTVYSRLVIFPRVSNEVIVRLDKS